MYCRWLLPALIILIAIPAFPEQPKQAAQPVSAQKSKTNAPAGVTRDEERPQAFVALLNIMRRKDLVEVAGLYKIPVLDADSEDIIRKKILELVTGTNTSAVVEQGSLAEQPRSKRVLEGGGIRLIGADNVERYTVRTGATEEELIRIVGSVKLKIYDFTITAGTIIYSVTSDEVFGFDGISIDNGEQMITGVWFSLNRSTKVGVLHKGTSFLRQQGITIYSDIIKFTDGRFFADNAALTTSSLVPPSYFFSVNKTYIWEQKKVMALGMAYQVGAQPFFYFPLFVQNYWGTGIHSSFGSSLREGLYVQNSKDISFLSLPHHLRFDLYQKLGLFAGDELSLNGPAYALHFNLMNALSRKAYTFFSPNSDFGLSRLVNYFPTNSTVSSPLSYRYKVAADGTLYLNRNGPEETSLRWNTALMSDLYFRNDYERKKPVFDLFRQFQSLQYQMASENVNRSEYDTESGVPHTVSFLNRGSTHSFSLNAAYTETRVRNLSAPDSINNDDYKFKPGALLLPSIAFSYGGVIDRQTNTNQTAFNIGYNFGVQYSHTILYAEKPMIAFSNNPALASELNAVLSERDVIGGNGSLSRGFSLPFLNYTPSLSVAFQRQNTANPLINDLIIDRKNTYTTTASTHALSLFLPPDLVSNVARYITPRLSGSVYYSIDYKIGEYEPNEPYGGFRMHQVSANIETGFTGYGLFYIKDLDAGMSLTAQSGYDLRIPYYYSNAAYAQLTYDPSRISLTSVNGQATLTHPLFSAAYTLGYNIVNNTLYANTVSAGTSVKLPLQEALALFIPYASEKTNDGRLFAAAVNANINYDFINFYASSFSASFTMDIRFPEFITFYLQASSINRHLYAYLPDYADYAKARGIEVENPFIDLLNSINFFNNAKRVRSNFKLQQIAMGLSHEVDGWLYGASLQIAPRSLSELGVTGSVKGTYWDKTVSFFITLKAYPSIGFKQENLHLNTALTN
ncbi:MAG: hypothetical protein HZC28_00345 [Spirochaetes bacterium]|nr:hypothetical protein [Spirochaetota bacterium]